MFEGFEGLRKIEINKVGLWAWLERVCKQVLSRILGFQEKAGMKWTITQLEFSL